MFRNEATVMGVMTSPILTYSICFAKMACYDIVQVVILTQVELQQIDFHFTVFNKHAVFNHLEMNI